jgi:hypothetical protein
VVELVFFRWLENREIEHVDWRHPEFSAEGIKQTETIQEG